MNFDKLKEVYVPKISTYKKLSHFSNNHYEFGNIKQYLKGLFTKNSCLVIILQRRLWTIRNESYKYPGGFFS